MRNSDRWSRIAEVVGGISLVAGSLDPLEGSVLILPGSALLVLGSYLKHGDRRTIRYRAWSLVLIALGVAALFALSAAGGIGGSSGRSMWWAVLILPYLVGWSLDLWGPGAAQWLSTAGIAVGVWYVAILLLMIRREEGGDQPREIGAAIAIGAIGIGTIAACAARLTATRRA